MIFPCRSTYLGATYHSIVNSFLGAVNFYFAKILVCEDLSSRIPRRLRMRGCATLVGTRSDGVAKANKHQ